MMATSFPDPMFVPRSFPGKRDGLVATRPIPQGTRILKKESTVPIPPPAGKELVGNNLTRIHLPVKYAIPEHDIAFVCTSGINHACDPNATYHWNDNIKAYTVHALREIHKDEEITINYLCRLHTLAGRQAVLWHEFGIRCLCNLCILPDEQREAVDKLTAAFGGAQKGINSLQDTDDTEITGTDDDRSALLRACRLLAGMYDDNGPNDGGVAEINLLAAKIAIIDGDMARGKVFAARAMREFTVEQGADCRVVAKQGYLASDPTRFVLHGIVSPRPTKVSDIPTNLSDDDFEDWLWGPFLLQQMGLGVPLETELGPEISEGVHTTNTTSMANLRDQTIFPTWTGLPHEEGLDPSPYHAAVDKGGVFTPKSHWCLLGKITSYFRLRRLEIYVEDLSGRTFHLIFRTDARGGEVPHDLLVKGNAVAVLYPVRYTNMIKHRGSGIQVKESGMIKIFPKPLASLLGLNDRIQQFCGVLPDAGFRTCYGCGTQKPPGSMFSCTGCRVFWFCGPPCLRSAWKGKNHKDDCYLVRDPDVKALLDFNWGVFDGPVSFPLPV